MRTEHERQEAESKREVAEQARATSEAQRHVFEEMRQTAEHLRGDTRTQPHPTSSLELRALQADIRGLTERISQIEAALDRLTTALQSVVLEVRHIEQSQRLQWAYDAVERAHELTEKTVQTREDFRKQREQRLAEYDFSSL